MARKPCAKLLLLGSWLVHAMATVAGAGAVGATYLLAEAYQALTALRACGRPSSTVPKQRATGAGNCTPTLDLAHAEAWMALVALLASLIVFRRRGRRGGGGGPSTRSISDTLWHHYHWRRAAQRWHHQCVAKSWHHCCAARATPPPRACLGRCHTMTTQSTPCLKTHLTHSHELATRWKANHCSWQGRNTHASAAAALACTMTRMWRAVCAQGNI